MFNLGAASPNNTSLFPQTTPINQNRTGTGFSFGNSTITQPLALTSTPFSTPTVFGGTTPSTTIIQSSRGTIHKFDPVFGTDKVTKNGVMSSARTKHINLCAMPQYEKKSMEELRLEDYSDNRKFPSTGSTFFSTTTTTATTPSFGGTLTTANPSTSSLALNTSLFGNKSGLTSSATLPFTFGSTATTTTSSVAPFGSAISSVAPTTSTTPFTFGSGQTATTTTTTPFAFGSSQVAAPTTTTTTPAFNFGGSTAFSPATSTATSTAPAFGFSLSKPTTGTTFSFTPSTAPTTTTTTTSIFPTATTTNPMSFTTAAAPTSIDNSQSSVDTRTHLQLFQTMLNIQPFNSELGFLARNIKPNIGLDRTRLRTAPDSTNIHSLNNVFSPLLTKPSVLSSNPTATPPSTFPNPLPTHSHTLPTVLLPTSTTNTTIGLFGKRKLADSFLDDDDDNSLMMDDGPSSSSTSITKISKTNLIKRPRVLDMNKIRSVVLGNNTNEITFKEENPSDTFIVKPTSDNLSGWKKFNTYDAYLASKKQQIQTKKPHFNQNDEDEKKINHQIDENKFQQERAFRLPKLTHDDYYTNPTIDELRHCFNQQGQCFVKEFTVGREHYGSVTFQGSKINLAGLDLNQLIEISRRQITVYPDDNNKPVEGEELNCQATISLIGVYPIDRSISNSGEEVTDPDRLIDMNYENYLCEMTKKFHGKFLNYDVYTGTWTFKVDHF